MGGIKWPPKNPNKNEAKSAEETKMSKLNHIFLPDFVSLSYKEPENPKILNFDLVFFNLCVPNVVSFFSSVSKEANPIQTDLFHRPSMTDIRYWKRLVRQTAQTGV